MNRIEKRRKLFIKGMIEAGTPEEELLAYKKAYPKCKGDKAAMTNSGRLLKVASIREAINKGRQEREEEMKKAMTEERLRIAKEQVAHEIELDAKLSQIALGTHRRKRKVAVFNREKKVFEVMAIEEEPSETDIIAASDKLYRRKGSYAAQKTDLTSGGKPIKTNTGLDLSKVPLETLLEIAKHISDTETKG